ncbi:holin, partial [Lactiplantibacillus pentosus]|nr:holin [Lactiplantibacillus pentosus]MCT3311463.1 holin [Lactiplantibacillus pentosus]
MAQYDDTTKLLMDIQKDVAATKTKVENIEEKL